MNFRWIYSCDTIYPCFAQPGSYQHFSEVRYVGDYLTYTIRFSKIHGNSVAEVQPFHCEHLNFFRALLGQKATLKLLFSYNAHWLYLTVYFLGKLHHEKHEKTSEKRHRELLGGKTGCAEYELKGWQVNGECL